MKHLRCGLAVLGLLAACAGAHAELSEPLEAGDCEIELDYGRQTARRTPTQREASASLGCGVGGGTELTLGFSHTRSAGASDKAISAEGKTTLSGGQAGGITWALVYGVEAERDGARWRRSEQHAALEAGLELDRAWSVEALLGTARDLPSRRNRTLWTLAIERAFSDDLEARAELGGDDRSRPMLGLELRHSDWLEDVEVKLFAGARAGRSRERHIGLGVSFEF